MNTFIAQMLYYNRRAQQGQKAYSERAAKKAQVNNYTTGKIVAVDGDGRHTVELTSGRQMMVYSASGTNYVKDDYVSIRYLSGDKRQAEIAGKTTKVKATSTRQVWR